MTLTHPDAGQRHLLSLISYLLSLICCSAASAGPNFFRVTPYVQHPATNAMTVMWFMQERGGGRVSWWEADAEGKPKVAARGSKSRYAPELYYIPTQTNYAKPYLPFTIPVQHRVRLDGLKAGTRYCYKV